MNRYLVNAQAELQTTFYVDGVATDPTPNTALVTIVRDDGTAIITSQSATPDTPPPLGSFVYNLTPGQNNRLDRLTATFVSALGNGVEKAEVCGGFLISAVDLVELYPNATNRERANRRTDIETRLESSCGIAFVPRYERERETVRRGRLRLKWGSIRRLVSVTAQGLVLTQTQIDALDVDWDKGYVRGLPASRSHGDVVITYEHGADFANEVVHSVAMSAMQETYGPNRIDGRVIAKSVDNVSVTYARNSMGGNNAAVVEFTSSDVVSFILNNRRPMVG